MNINDIDVVKSVWYPVYAIRQVADVNIAINEIIDDACRGEEITVYSSEKKASKVARNMLCDDDDAAVVEIDVFESGYVVFYPVSKKSVYSSFHVHAPALIEKFKVVD